MTEALVKKLIHEELQKLHGANGITVNHPVISASQLDARLKKLEQNIVSQIKTNNTIWIGVADGGPPVATEFRIYLEQV